MTFKHKLSRRLALLFSATAVVALAMNACEIPLVTTPPADVAQLIISPKTATVQPDQDVMFTSVAFTAQGDTAQISVSWSTTGGSVTDTSTSGKRHYGHWRNASCGTFKVAATSHPGSKSDTASVTVTCAAPVASVSVNPPAASVQVSGTVQLTATPKDANGNPLSGRTVTWSSSNTSMASVNGSGLVTGAAVGTATITATSEGQSGSASITVLPPAANKFVIGDRVQTTGVANIRSAPALSGTLVGTQPLGALGTVVGGPVVDAAG